MVNKSSLHQPDNNHDANHSLFVGSFEKGLRVLQAFRHTHSALGLVEIAEITGLNKSAVQRFTHTLHKLGYLTKDENTKQYLPSAQILDFAYLYLRSDPLMELAAPHLLEASEQCHEVVNLGKLVGVEIMYTIRIPNKRGRLPIPLVGARAPVYCTASGRALLSGRPQEEVEAVLNACNCIPLTPRTITDRDRILELINDTREQGFTIAEEECLPGELTVAAPIMNHKDRSVAAINMSVVTKHWDKDGIRRELAPIVMRTAAIISRTQGKKSTY